MLWFDVTDIWMECEKGFCFDHIDASHLKQTCKGMGAKVDKRQSPEGSFLPSRRVFGLTSLSHSIESVGFSGEHVQERRAFLSSCEKKKPKGTM